MHRLETIGLTLLLVLGAGSPEADAAADVDVAPGAPLVEGDVIGLEDVHRLAPHLPPEFWTHRDLFFYEGMRLEIGPEQADYAPPPAYAEATARYGEGVRLGPDGSLEGYVAGQPFPMDEIDCLGDPNAGAKIMWNFDYRWNGDGTAASFLYSYWDRGERLPLYFEGHSKSVALAHRVEPEHLDARGGDLFRRESRKRAQGIEVTAPFEARGIKLLSYRYKAADQPRAEARNDDAWVYVPTLRRVRRISTAQRTDAVSGTDFTFDDLFSFDGIVPQYEWSCLGEREVVAPMNTRVKAWPYDRDHDFGPYGVSYADDRWQLRRSVVVRMVPRNPDHPYSRKDLYLDWQTLEPHYSFAYDRKGELWKILWHNKRWSGDRDLTGEWYGGWDGVEEPRDLRVVSDTIVNVQTGTGNRIEIWDNHGKPLPSRGRTRRYIDVGRLERNSH